MIRGIHEFGKMREGDVLVIPYSDAGWTPLFSKAGAVIAESGGILSHSSIVAREYNIPAVVSVAGACNLTDDVVVTIDGYSGEVLIHEPSDLGGDVMRIMLWLVPIALSFAGGIFLVNYLTAHPLEMSGQLLLAVVSTVWRAR